MCADSRSRSVPTRLNSASVIVIQSIAISGRPTETSQAVNSASHLLRIVAGHGLAIARRGTDPKSGKKGPGDHRVQPGNARPPIRNVIRRREIEINVLTRSMDFVIGPGIANSGTKRLSAASSPRGPGVRIQLPGRVPSVTFNGTSLPSRLTTISISSPGFPVERLSMKS